MATIFEYHRHPRAAELAAKGPVTSTDLRKTDHPNVLVRLNNRFGLRVTLVVGTMWCAYLFTVIALFALPSAIHQGTYYIVVWLSSSFLQLVLLPIIIVGQNIQAASADKRSEDTYKDAEAVLQEAAQIQAHLEAQDRIITEMAAKIAAMAGPSPS